jgi:aminoglycoside phosphotransferase (APT) family kinase protein
MIDIPTLTKFIASMIDEHFGDKVPCAAVHLEYHDWRWFALVNNFAVAFVAEDQRAADRLGRERQVLQLLKSRVSFGIPVPVYCSVGLPQVDIRRCAPGNTGVEFHQNLLAQRSLGIAAGERMAYMLAQLHGSATLSDASAVGLTALEEGSWPIERIGRALSNCLDTHLHPNFYVVLAWYNDKRTCSAGDAVLVHGDFGSHNFSFDSQTGLPLGLFDFEAVCWNDRHYDFSLLPSYGDQIMARTLETYGRLTGVTISVEQVRLHHAAYALSNLAWRIENFDAGSNDIISGVRWVEQALVAVNDRA